MDFIPSKTELAQRRAEKKYFKEHRSKIKLTPGDIVFNIFNYIFGCDF